MNYMKKRDYITRLGFAALVLGLTSTCLLGGTFARYTTEVKGTATATAAKWSFKVNGGNDSLTSIILKPDGETAMKENVIAPGTNGHFDIELDGSGSDVGIEYEIKFANAAGSALPSNFIFKVDKAEYDIKTPIIGTISYNATDNAMKKTVTVYWEWPLDKEDSTDNTLAGKTYTLNVTVTGKQATPATPSES